MLEGSIIIVCISYQVDINIAFVWSKLYKLIMQIRKYKKYCKTQYFAGLFQANTKYQ